MNFIYAQIKKFGTPINSLERSINKECKMKKKYILIIAILLVNTFDIASANSSFFAGINTGGHVFESNRNLGDTPLGGLTFGYHFNDRISAAVRVYTGKYKIRYSINNQTCATEYINGNLYHSDLYYTFLPKHRIRPYISAGFGKFNLKHSKSENLYHDFFDQGVLFNYGAGFDFFIHKISFMGDIRHFAATGVSRNELVFSSGINFHFSKF